MWKIFFKYGDGSKLTITNNASEITLEQAIKYHTRYGDHAVNETYQKYPKEKNQSKELPELIEEMQKPVSRNRYIKVQFLKDGKPSSGTYTYKTSLNVQLGETVMVTEKAKGIVAGFEVISNITQPEKIKEIFGQIKPFQSPEDTTSGSIDVIGNRYENKEIFGKIAKDSDGNA